MGRLFLAPILAPTAVNIGYPFGLRSDDTSLNKTMQGGQDRTFARKVFREATVVWGTGIDEEDLYSTMLIDLDHAIGLRKQVVFTLEPGDVITAPAATGKASAKGVPPERPGIKSAFRAAINFIIDGWNGLQFKIPGFKIGPVGYDGFTLGVPDIPRLATGGIAMAPTLAVVGVVVGELLGQSLVSLVMLGDDQQSRRVLVDAVHDARTPLAANPRQGIAAMVQ